MRDIGRINGELDDRGRTAVGWRREVGGDAASKDGLVIARLSQSVSQSALSQVSGILIESRTVQDRGHSNDSDNKHQPTTNKDKSLLKVCWTFVDLSRTLHMDQSRIFSPQKSQ